MSKKKLVIIDGNALIHRSFHALPPTLTTKNGQIVNAVYGFTSFLIKSLVELEPQYIILTLDEKGPTFRHKEYSEYKAKRKKSPQELYDQIPLVRKIAKAFSIPTYSKQGFEADDLIGSIVDKLKDNKKLEKIIITGDYDTLQLINNETKVYTMSRGLSDSITYDSNKVEEKYGLRPDQIIDYKALRGDPSDNIPGVPGIGEKTAVDLLQLFDTLENIYKHIEDKPETKSIKERTLKLLQENKEKAFLSKKLATIKKDVDINIDIEKCSLENLNFKDIEKVLMDFEFKSMLSRLSTLKKALGNKKEENSKEEDKFLRDKKNFDYTLIDSDKNFDKFLKQLKKQSSFTFDTEAESLDIFNANLLGISFSWKEKEAFYLNLSKEKTNNQLTLLNNKKNINEKTEEKDESKNEKNIKYIFSENKRKWLEKLKPIFENKKIEKYGHNIKFDIKLLSVYGIEVKGISFDTKIAAYLINPGNRQHSLDSLSLNELNIEKISSDDLLGTGKNKINYNEVNLDKMFPYSCEDADCTNRLVSILKKELKKQKLDKLFYELELPLIEVLVSMENNGINLNLNHLEKINKIVTLELEKLTKEIYKHSKNKFNINSPKQLQEIIFSELEIPTENIKKTKTGYSTAFDELEKLKNYHPIIDLIQSYRELNKIKTTYIDSLPELVNSKTKKIHTNFNQTVTATGRLSSLSPNLQNIPKKNPFGKEIRQAFTSKKGFTLLSLDYSQIELRIAAHLSKDKKMIKQLLEKKDIHKSTAAYIYQIQEKEVTKEMRQKAKSINFGILYGQGPHGLAQNAKIPYYQAKDFIEKYFENYSGIKKYIENTIKKASETSYTSTILGRQRYLPEINSQISLVKKMGERMAINTPIQGSAADIIKLAMLKIYKKYKNDTNLKMLIQVHDELIFNVKDGMEKKYGEEIKKIMENIIDLKVPLLVDIEIGKNWGDLKRYN